jgi:hypothetical protein
VACEPTVNDDFRRLAGININILTAEDFDRQSRSDFTEAQRSDPSLEYWRTIAEQGSPRYVMDGELLFKNNDHWSGAIDKLLVVPSEYRAQVLDLADNSPFGGHLGRKKDGRAQGKLTWPKVDKFVREWIARCSACQLVAPLKKSDRLPLAPIPRIAVPFMDVSFDTLGSSLKATPRGNQYLLTHVDNASRYVDIVPMKNLKTDTTINALMSIWTTVGFPQRARFD